MPSKLAQTVVVTSILNSVGAVLPNIFLIVFNPNRLMRVEEKLAGLSFTRINAADVQSDMFSPSSERDGDLMYNQQRSRAHVRAWKIIARAIPNEHEYSVVLEDNAVFVRPQEKGGKTANNHKECLSNLFLQRLYNNHVDFSYLSRASRGIYRDRQQETNDHFQECVHNDCTNAYIIQAGAARKLMEYALSYREVMYPLERMLSVVLSMNGHNVNGARKKFQASGTGSITAQDLDAQLENSPSCSVRLSCLALVENLVVPCENGENSESGRNSNPSKKAQAAKDDMDRSCGNEGLAQLQGDVIDLIIVGAGWAGMAAADHKNSLSSICLLTCPRILSINRTGGRSHAIAIGSSTNK